MKKIIFHLLCCCACCCSMAQMNVTDSFIIKEKTFFRDDSIYTDASIVTKGNVVIKKNTNVLFRSGQSIFLSGGFRTEPGAGFSAMVIKNQDAGKTSLPIPAEDKTKGSHISLFPNPGYGVFNIKAANVVSIRKIEIANSHGEIIKSYTPANGLIDGLVINLSSYQPGAYQVIFTGKNSVDVEKILLLK